MKITFKLYSSDGREIRACRDEHECLPHCLKDWDTMMREYAQLLLDMNEEIVLDNADGKLEMEIHLQSGLTKRIVRDATDFLPNYLKVRVQDDILYLCPDEYVANDPPTCTVHKDNKTFYVCWDPVSQMWVQQKTDQLSPNASYYLTERNTLFFG